MDPQYFLRGCWKKSEVARGDDRKAQIATVALIQTLLKIETSPETTLTMILYAILPGVCCHDLQKMIATEEKNREGNNLETVKLFHAIYAVESLSVSIKLIMTMAMLLPDFLGKPLEGLLRAVEERHDANDYLMTPSQSLSFAQHAGTIN